ncbi:MAG: hypothetical protein MZU97_13465 [Bacillus subtilis]|nr:hypothetical protein [Bacillus subtilis]
MAFLEQMFIRMLPKYLAEHACGSPRFPRASFCRSSRRSIPSLPLTALVSVRTSSVLAAAYGADHGDGSVPSSSPSSAPFSGMFRIFLLLRRAARPERFPPRGSSQSAYRPHGFRDIVQGHRQHRHGPRTRHCAIRSCPQFAHELCHHLLTVRVKSPDISASPWASRAVAIIVS